MRATTWGLEMVCPRPIGKLMFSWAWSPSALSTNRWRSTAPIACNTGADAMPPAASLCTMRALISPVSAEGADPAAPAGAAAAGRGTGGAGTRRRAGERGGGAGRGRAGGPGPARLLQAGAPAGPNPAAGRGIGRGGRAGAASDAGPWRQAHCGLRPVGQTIVVGQIDLQRCDRHMAMRRRVKVRALRIVLGGAGPANPVHGLAARALLHDDALGCMAPPQAAQRNGP